MFDNLGIAKKGLLLVAIPLTFELLFVSGLQSAVTEQNKKADEIEISKDNLLNIHSLETRLLQSLVTIASEESRSGPEMNLEFQTLNERLNQAIASFNALLAIRPERSGEIKDAMCICDEAKALSVRAKRIFDDATIPPIKRSKYLRNDMNALLLEAKPVLESIAANEERFQSHAPEEVEHFFWWIAAFVACGTVVNICLSACLVLMFSRGVVQRLRTIAANIQRLAFSGQLQSPLTGKDEITNLDRVVHDVAAILSEARRKETAIIDQAADVIFCLDRRGRFTQVSLAAKKIWNQPADDVLGSSIYGALTQEDASKVRAFIEEATETNSEKEAIYELEMRFSKSPPIEALLSMKWSKESQFFSCVAHDDSVRRSTERLKQRFVAIVSHDLRTPLTSVAASFDLLINGARGTVPEKAKELLAKTRANVERLLALANELLEIEKLRSGAASMPVSCVSAHDVLSAARDLVESFARQAQVSIVGPDGDQAILANEKRLIQAMVNLLSNAIKFSPSGETVRLDLQRQGNFVELAVTDSGPGIAESDRAMIFERFRQSGSVTKTGVKGTGLGLALVKATAEAHHGSAGVTCGDEKGSRFFVRIPAFGEEDSQ